jgi:outer membrane receptor for ferrienterochelin and colicins
MKIPLLVLFILLLNSVFSQITGNVYVIIEDERKPLQGAVVRCRKDKCTQQTDQNGRFYLAKNHRLPDTIIVSMFEYEKQVILVTEADSNITLSVQLFENIKNIEVNVSSRRIDTGISKLKTLHVQNLGEGELKKAACCNIAESFETNASVDVNITDAVSGAKRIQMMGLDGVYTQLQMENIPFLRGIESSFGLTSIPGPWVESIQITKGVGTVVNGYESMAGLVNFEFKKPEKQDKLYLNAYAGVFGRTELNLMTGGKINRKWGSSLFLHGAGNQVEIDFNKDKFRDLPRTQNFSAHNRWTYHGKKMEAQFGATAYIENKEGGQLGFKQNVRPDLYGFYTNSNHLEAFAKTGFFFPKKNNKSLGIIYNAKLHETKAGVGKHTYSGFEKRVYLNAILDLGTENSIHYVKIGGGASYTDLVQKVDTLQVNRVDFIPGIFSEYSFRYNRVNVIFGARYDYHQKFGSQFTPRIHGRWSATPKTDLRYSAGKGFRIPNVYIDHLAMRTTSRTWMVDQNLKPEVSWNAGASIVHDLRIHKMKATITSDYYYTWFQNQLIMDLDTDPTHIMFANQKSASFSHAWQTELSFFPAKNIEVRLVYKMLNVQAKTNGIFQQQTLVPTHRGMFNFNYRTRNKKWQYDATVQFYGKSRLPINRINATETTTDSYGKSFARVNAQITRNFKQWEFYIGGENLTNTRQNNPIIGSDNPFGNYFDATRVWGQILGIYGYAGLRFTMKHPK